MFSVREFLILSCFCIFTNNLLPVFGTVKPDHISTSTMESTSALTTEGTTSVETTPEFVTRRRTTPPSRPKTTTKPTISIDETIDWMIKTLPTTTRRVRIATTTRTIPTTTVGSTTTPLTTTKRTIPTTVTTPRTTPTTVTTPRTTPTTVTTPRTTPTTVTTPRTTPQTTQKYFPRYRTATKSATYDPFNEVFKDIFPYVWKFDQPKPLPPFYHESIYNQPNEEYPISPEASTTITPRTTTTRPETTTKPLVIYQDDGNYWVISNYRNHTNNNKANAMYFQDSLGEEEEDRYPSHLYGEGLRYYRTTTTDKITKKPTYKTTTKSTTTTIPLTSPQRTTEKVSTRSEEYIDTATPLYAEYPAAAAAGAKASYGNEPSNSNPLSYIRIHPKIYDSNPNPQEKSYYQDIQPQVPNMKYYTYGNSAQKS